MVLKAIELLDLLNAGIEAVAGFENRAPEPISAWYTYTPGCHALISEDLIGVATGRIGEFACAVHAHTPLNELVHIVIKEVGNPHTGEQKSLAQGPLRAGAVAQGHWFRVDDTPPLDLSSYDDWWNWLYQHGEKIQYWLDRDRSVATGKPRQSTAEVFAVVYKEEREYRRYDCDQWQVCMRVREAQTGQTTDRVAYPHILPAADSYFRRMPFLEGLRNKRVVLLGLGALGSMIAVELARAGVGAFVLIDHEDLRPGNIVRHASDLRMVGVPKTAAVGMHIGYINPSADVTYITRHIGIPSDNDMFDDIELLEEEVKKSDIVISAIEVSNIDYWLADIVAAFGVPCIYASVFYNAWGGQVFRSRPGEACFKCYTKSDQFADVPMPADTPDLYFDGCGDPSAPGAGFDTSVVSNLATRLSVQTLLASDAYPDATYNLISWSSRGEAEGDYPKIEFHVLPPRPVCQTCNPKRVS